MAAFGLLELLSSGASRRIQHLPQGSSHIFCVYPNSIWVSSSPSKIESSLYQDFHVLYVHIERDKKQEGNESEKLSQFCQRTSSRSGTSRFCFYLCSSSDRFHAESRASRSRHFQWNIDEMQNESITKNAKKTLFSIFSDLVLCL